MPACDAPDTSPLLCAHCAAELTPGEGNFYVVRIEAVADPTPPEFTAEDLQTDFRAEIEQLLARMRERSPQELLDEIYRHLVLYLCGPCFRRWIEHPAG